MLALVAHASLLGTLLLLAFFCQSWVGRSDVNALEIEANLGTQNEGGPGRDCNPNQALEPCLG